MPRTTVTLTSNRYPELARRMPHALREIRQETAAEIETTIKTGMAAGKTGLMHGRHQASAPGEMPAIDTGALVNSIQVEEEGSDTTVVFTNQEYADELEYGRARMAARPFMTPSAEAARPGWHRRLATLERRLDE